MLCKNCGKKINDNTTICPVCGKTTGATVKSQPVRLQQAHKISSMANSNPAPNRFAALMSTNKKRNMIIAAIVILLVVIITILIISSRSESNKFQHKTSKIIGKWDLYASTNNKGEMEDESDITFEFTDDGRI
ncbi:MAG: zinc ribbon domain-containing protein, partial [Ruminococcus sp.]|nr:zinc ribbon domain-containing protein [Ruminococcus sp.]